MIQLVLNGDLAVALPPLSVGTDEQLAISTVVLFMMGFAVYKIHGYRVKKARASRLEEIDETAIENVEPGLTIVSGTAKPAGETLERETQDGDCLGRRRRTVTYEWTTEKNRDRGEQDDSSMKRTESTSTEATSFLVEDTTGTILVSADSTPTLQLRETDSVEVEPSDTRHINRDTQKHTSKIRKTYWELLPGDDVTVYGNAVKRTDHDSDQDVDADTEMVITENDDTGDFTVTHFDKEFLIDRNSSKTPLIVGGLILLCGISVLGYVWLIL